MNTLPGVLVEVSSQYRASTVDVTRAVEKELAAMRPAIAAAGIEINPAMFRPADFINTAIRSLSTAFWWEARLSPLCCFCFFLTFALPLYHSLRFLSHC